MIKGHRSIKQNSITFIIFIIVMIGLTGMMIENFLEQNIINRSRDESLEVSSHMAKAISDQLNVSVKELEFLANVIADSLSEESTLALNIWNDEIKSDFFDELYLAKPNGVVYSSEGIERNFENRGFFKLALEGEVSISNPTISEFDGERVIMYTVPIKKNGQVIGALSGRNTVDELNKVVLSKIYGFGTDVYIVGDNGEVIISNNLDNSLLVSSFNDYYINLNRSKDVQLPYILSTNHSQSIEWTNKYNHRTYINYQKIDSISDWYVLTTANPDRLAQKIHNTEKVTLLVVMMIWTAVISFHFYVTKMKKDSLEYIERLAFNDSLTGLFNNDGFVKEIKSVLKRSPYRYYSLVAFDIESFKLVNEIYGYSKGDRLLIEIAQQLKSEFHSSTIFGRLGNDVFTLMLAKRIQYDEDNISSRIERVVRSVSENIIEMTLNVNIGFYDFKTQEENIQLAVDHADMARVHAKTLPDNYYVFNQDVVENEKKLKEIEQAIKSSLEQGHFQVYYQPKVNPITEKIAGAEALVRWFHPERGFISPADFIPISEKSGDIVDIGRWVFNEVCLMLADQKQKGLKSVPISINLSPVEFYQSDLIVFLASTISKYQVDPSLIEIEITETAALNDITLINEKIASIHDLGMKVSMDDFGTGSSTFSNLKHVDIDVLKIDRSFLCDIETNFKSKEMVHGIIELAKRIGISVVCEGVEVQEQVEILKEMKCDFIQGYVYSKPLPRPQFEEWI
ncbi:EAL domain-containing protein [Turicibacter sp. TJ11]|uniref:bifunctional diguanylate cyclase/phosphodiesterase n=1 Tax=Turicibacter sp. TJ11 TaxID=2806443 RepID=UPI001F2A9D80|nr:EAL domain-containing protein [Turicibacter sp. TJ11]